MLLQQKNSFQILTFPSLSSQRKKQSTPAFTEDKRGRSPSLSLFSHLSETWPSFPTATDFVPSCEIHLEVQMEKIKTNRALIQVRASIPLSQVIKRNSWLNYTTTNGFTPPTCLKDCQNQNLQKESSFPTLKPPPLETRLLLCESAHLQSESRCGQQCSFSSAVSDKVTAISNVSSPRPSFPTVAAHWNHLEL